MGDVGRVDYSASSSLSTTHTSLSVKPFSSPPSNPSLPQNERVNRLMVAGMFGAVHSLEGFISRWRYCGLTDPRGTLGE